MSISAKTGASLLHCSIGCHSRHARCSAEQDLDRSFHTLARSTFRGECNPGEIERGYGGLSPCIPYTEPILGWFAASNALCKVQHRRMFRPVMPMFPPAWPGTHEGQPLLTGNKCICAHLRSVVSRACLSKRQCFHLHPFASMGDQPHDGCLSYTG